jgi:hypothetical protein
MLALWVGELPDPPAAPSTGCTGAPLRLTEVIFCKDKADDCPDWRQCRIGVIYRRTSVGNGDIRWSK